MPRRNPRLYSELHAGKFEVLSVDDDPVNQVRHRWFDPVFLDMDFSPSWTTKLHICESGRCEIKIQGHLVVQTDKILSPGLYFLDRVICGWIPPAAP
jgi:hypothetical protein